MKLKKISVTTILAFALFAAVVVWFLFAVGNMKTVSDKQELESVRRNVENSITLCYSIEGAYPESFDYLTSSYGLVYDTERYIVHYSYFAGNVRPSVSVIRKGA